MDWRRRLELAKQFMIKFGFVFSKAALLILLIALSVISLIALRSSFFFLILLLVSIIFFCASLYVFIPMVSQHANVEHEKYLFFALFVTYVIITVFIAPNFDHKVENNVSTLESRSEKLKIFNDTPKNGETFPNSINESLNRPNSSSPVGKYQKDNSIYMKLNSQMKKYGKKIDKDKDYDDFTYFKSIFLILIVFILLCQGTAWGLAEKVYHRPVQGLLNVSNIPMQKIAPENGYMEFDQGFDVEGGSQPENIPVQPIAQENENLELGLNQISDSLSPAQSALREKYLTRRICRQTQENILEPQEGLDRVNYESFSRANPSVAAPASETISSTIKNLSSKSDLSMAEAAVAGAHRETIAATASWYREATAAATSSYRETTAAAVRSHRTAEPSSQRRDLFNTLSRISEESFSQEEKAETSL